MTEVDYYRKLAEDCVFAARESVDQDIRDACMKDAAHFRALAKRLVTTACFSFFAELLLKSERACFSG